MQDIDISNNKIVFSKILVVGKSIKINFVF